MPENVNQPIYSSKFDDISGEWEITEIIRKLREIQDEYGMNSKVIFDTGYNNVSVQILPSKKQRIKS